LLIVLLKYPLGCQNVFLGQPCKVKLKIRRVKKYKIALAINLVGAFLCPSVKADKA